MAPGNMNIDQIYAIAQQIAVGVLGLGVVVQAVRQKLKKPKADGEPGTAPIRLPADALAKEHPDPVVRRLEDTLAGMGRQLDNQQRRLDDADRREADMRQDLEDVRREARENGDRVYWLRRIVRRLIDSWPPGNGIPPLSQHEWDIVGVDEDTMPGRPDLTRPPVEDFG